ncbi:hypothetical protein L249_2439 [Ophiocordyceps polyrhachis-furcata BCC 54312]|uniref:ATP synthase subunit 5, mitochondrial n=1 Tax=Ophiocordyceps polyrhachis-furcata BCC 54312 TaxID=1330021 RepID=A0A367LQ31_9HYPO|nr:hypothetical protein L249_2439 [Ophiocordyceps polyrhachis-furcata BCC 54312]
MLSRKALASFRGRGAVVVVKSAQRAGMATRARRTFAAAAAAPSSSAEEGGGGDGGKPPISVFGLDGTYASALVFTYTAASKSSTLDSTARAMTSLSNTFSKDAKLSQVLATPTLTPKDKEAVVAELAKAIGGTTTPTVKNFLDALAENNRLGLLQAVCGKFADLMAASKGEVQMTVTSAQPLDNKTLSRLETAITKSPYLAQGKRLKVHNQVNSDILGGLVVEIGDRTIDLSVSSRVAKMNKLLTDNL